MSELEAMTKELKEIKTMLNHLIESRQGADFTELSLNRASKYLRRGIDTIKRKVEEGEIKALIDIHNGKPTYRFLLKDLRDYQESRRQERVSVPHIHKTIFNGQEYFSHLSKQVEPFTNKQTLKNRRLK